MTMTESGKKQYKAMAALCSKTEYAMFDIRQKLKGQKLEDDEIEDIMNELVLNRFLDDERYSLAYANDKLKFNHWGKYKIQQALLQKYISESTIKKSLDALQKEEYEKIALHEANKKWKTLYKLEPEVQTQKTIQYLLSKGFEYEMLIKIVKQMVKHDIEQAEN